jgi:NAD-dependent SIR2 family protein deacetylase
MNNGIDEIRDFVETAEAILVTAGAGMGVDSGLPDFRGDEGFWRAYPPLAKLGIRFEEMANPCWFEDDPELAWAFYGHRLKLYRETVPHKGFEMLWTLIDEKGGNGFVFTSNVDGQFQKAGFDEKAIYEVHGSIHHLQCLHNCTDAIWPNEEEVHVDMERFRALRIPRCPHCGGVARPNILMFGDWEWNSNRSEAQALRFGTWLEKNQARRMAIIEIGAGIAIPTVRHQGETLAARLPRARLIRINPGESEIDERLGWGSFLGGLEGIRTILGGN